MAAATGKSKTCAVREDDASVEGMIVCTRLSVALVEEIADAVLSPDMRNESGSNAPSVTRLRVDSTVRKGRWDIATKWTRSDACVRNVVTVGKDEAGDGLG